MASDRQVWVVGSGFLGSALAAACRAAGERVLTIDPVAEADVQGSAAETPVLRQALARLVPHVVYCCTATHGGTAEDYRVAYPEVVAALVENLPASCRLVFCSSTSLYAAAQGERITEESPLLASTERAKLLMDAESVVLGQGGVVARLVPLYGPGRCELVRRYLAGEPCLPGGAGRCMNYVHRDDAVCALRLLAADGAGVYNLCGESFTKGEMYARLQETIGLPVPAQESAPSKRGVSDMLVDSTRLRSLGWEPRHDMLTFARHWKEDMV